MSRMFFGMLCESGPPLCGLAERREEGEEERGSESRPFRPVSKAHSLQADRWETRADSTELCNREQQQHRAVGALCLYRVELQLQSDDHQRHLVTLATMQTAAL